MPDLNIEYHYQCSSIENFSMTFSGSNGEKYIVDQYRGKWHCDCTGFKFRKTCKHVEEAKKKQCTWSEMYDGGLPVDVPTSEEHPNGKACPVCGLEAVSRRYGV